MSMLSAAMRDSGDPECTGNNDVWVAAETPIWPMSNKLHFHVCREYPSSVESFRAVKQFLNTQNLTVNGTYNTTSYDTVIVTFRVPERTDGGAIVSSKKDGAYSVSDFNSLMSKLQITAGGSNWTPSNRKAVCADGKTRSLYKCASSPGKLFVRRLTKSSSSLGRNKKTTVKYVPFVPAPSASAKKTKKKNAAKK